MTAHRTAGQLRALRELCALARTGLEVCDVIATRGEETDDRPRQWLTSLERWSRGEETGPQLAARTRAMEAWRDAVFVALPKPVSPGTTDKWCDALHWLSDARADLMRNPGHDHHIDRVAWHTIRALATATGDEPAAAEAWFFATHARHRKAIGEECARAEAAARLRQAKADKVTAERALGTLPGMETTT